MGPSAYGSHNAIRDVICDIARHAGHKAVTTKHDAFLRTSDRARIPDIFIMNWTGRDTFVDVVISHSCYGCPRSMDGDPMGSMRMKREAIYSEGALIEKSVAKKMATYDELAAFRGLHMSYHALETPGRMSIDLVNFLRKGTERVTARCKQEFGAGGLDERARHLVQSNFQKFLRWISCARIRSVATRIVSAAGDEERRKEWRTTEYSVEPNALVRGVFSDYLITHEDAVFGLNIYAREPRPSSVEPTHRIS